MMNRQKANAMQVAARIGWTNSTASLFPFCYEPIQQPQTKLQ